MVKFAIPEYCLNAGKINEFGKSKYPEEKETLLPPYTAVRMKKRKKDYIFVEVAQDNKKLNFNMDVTNS